MTFRSWTLVGVVLGLVAAGSRDANAAPRDNRSAQPIATVVTQRGRISGAIDDRSDDDRLWLRCDFPSTSLLRGVAWSDILDAEVSGQRVTASELQQFADDVNRDRGVVLVERAAVAPELEPAMGRRRTPRESDASRACRLLGLTLPAQDATAETAVPAFHEGRRAGRQQRTSLSPPAATTGGLHRHAVQHQHNAG